MIFIARPLAETIGESYGLQKNERAEDAQIFTFPITSEISYLISARHMIDEPPSMSVI